MEGKGIDRKLLDRKFLVGLMILGVVGVILFEFMLKDVHSFGVDDSYIFYRYAENVSRGQGFVFNPGEPAGEGFTSWMWLLLLAFFHRIGVNIVFISKVLGIFFHTVSVSVLYLIIRRLTGEDAPRRSILTAAVLSLIFLLNYRIIAHSVSGMETALYIFSLLILIYLTTIGLTTDRFQPRWWLVISIASMAAFLVRPEGIAVGGASLLALAIKQRRDLRTVKPWLYLVLGLVIPMGLFIAMKMVVFGYPLPHSFYHKFIRVGNEYNQSFGQFRLFIQTYGWLIVPALVLPVWAAKSKVSRRYAILYYPALFLLMVSVYLFFYPAMNYLHRFYIPYVPLLLMAVSPGVSQVVGKLIRIPKVPVRVAAVALIAAIAVWGTNWDMGKSQQVVKNWSELVNPSVYRAHLGRLMSMLPRRVVVANSEMGVIPYYSRLTCIDMAGLTDPYIAHHGLSMDYLMRRHVDLILFPRKVETIAPSQWESFGINYKAVFLSPEFKQNFTCVGAYAAWPGGVNKYYIYVNNASPDAESIKNWREHVDGEFTGCKD